MQSTLSKLKLEVKNNELVKNSILGYTDVWKTSHYNTLSTIINEALMKSPFLQGDKKYEIGNTISAITLKRFFEDQISDTASTDLRFIKTLDKICIFVGYENFNSFINKNKNEELIFAENITEPINEEDQKQFEQIIVKCANKEFEFIETLPKIDLNDIESFVIKDSPYYSRIKNYLQKLLDQKRFLDKNLNSNFEVFNIVVKNKNEQSIVISTSEFWNLNFVGDDGEAHHYHTMNEQSYFLKKVENGEWKIWDNYNPNVWDLTSKI